MSSRGALTTNDSCIRILSDDARASVRAGQVIGSLGRAIEELVRNAALHGNAGRITVTVGGGDGTSRIGGKGGATSSANGPIVEVRDDGTGIDLRAMRDLIGVKHCSSEGKGETLMALAALCVEMRIRTASMKRARTDSPVKETNAPQSTGGTDAPRKRRRSQDFLEKQCPSKIKDTVVSCEKVIHVSNPVSFTCWQDGNAKNSLVPPSSFFGPVASHKDDETSAIVSSRGKSEISRTATGTTVTLRGLFHRHAVRRRHRERQASSADGRRHGSTTHPESADMAQARTSLRSLALLYPLVSFELWNGRTGAIDAKWPAIPSAFNRSFGLGAVPLSRSGLDPPLTLTATFSRPLDVEQVGPHTRRNTMDFSSALAQRLHQLCGMVSERHINIVYQEGKGDRSIKTGLGRASSPYFKRRRQLVGTGAQSEIESVSRIKNNNGSWSLIGALALIPVEEDEEERAAGESRTRLVGRVRQNEAIIVNDRPARHDTTLSDLVQKVICQFRDDGTAFVAFFIIHISCPSRDCDLVVDEMRATIAITNRDRLEKFIRKAISSAMMDNGFSPRRTMGTFKDISSLKEGKVQESHNARSSTSTSRTPKLFETKGKGKLSARLVSSENIGAEFTPIRKTGRPLHSKIEPTSTMEKVLNESSGLMQSPLGREDALKTFSPFSAAFLDEPVQPIADTNAKEDLMTDISFEDAFFEEDTALLGKSAPSEAKMRQLNKPDRTNTKQQERSSTDGLEWTRTRLRAIESQISSLVADPSLSLSSSKEISLSKAMLAEAHVIAQVDAKFIIINACGVLCIVDQHAADERIGLERLEHELLSKTVEASIDDASSSDMIKSVPLFPAQSLVLSPTQLAAIKENQNILEKWRFSFNVLPEKENVLLLSGVPGIFDKVATSKDFLQFVHALGNRTSDARLVKPTFVKKVLASHACRYAIMFGDVLSHERCVKLIKDLSKCNLCFVCAHGRPSVVPLLNMKTIGDGEILGGRCHQKRQRAQQGRHTNQIQKHTTSARTNH